MPPDLLSPAASPAPEPATRRRLQRVIWIAAGAQALLLALLVGWLVSRWGQAPSPRLFDDLMTAAAEDAAAAVALLGPAVLQAAPAACAAEPGEPEAHLARILARAAALNCRATAAHFDGTVGHFELICGARQLAVPLQIGPDGQLSFAPERRCPAFLSALRFDLAAESAPGAP